MEWDVTVFRRWRWVRELLALGVCTALPACTEVADGEDTLNADPSQTESNLASSQWSCVGQPRMDPPRLLEPDNVTFTIPIVNTVTRKTPAGLTVSACNSLDIECGTPMA